MKRLLAVLMVLAAASTALAAPLIYVGGVGVNVVAGYQVTDNGAAVPTIKITGANTTFNAPRAISEDTSANLCIANFSGNNLLSFAAGSNGNATPAGSVAGASTTFGTPASIKIDGSGNVWVGVNTANILEFVSCTAGNVAPLKTLTTAGADIEGVWVDPATGNVYGANTNANSIVEFDAPTGNMAAPSHTLVGAATTLNGPHSITLDASGNMWVANSSANSILEFTANTFGNQAPITTISGAGTGLSDPRGVQIAADGTIYVVNRTGGAPAFGTIESFAPGSSGNASPATTITSNSGANFSNPQKIYLEQPTPTATATATPTPAPTDTPTATPTPTPTPTATPTPTPTATATPVPAAGKSYHLQTNLLPKWRLRLGLNRKP